MMLLQRTFRPSPLADMRREFENLFGDFADGFGACRVHAAVPPLNIWEDAEHLYVEAEAPGVSKDDLDVNVVGNELTIKGRRKVSDDVDDLVYHRRERVTDEFARVLTLPVEVDANQVEATLRDGVLTIVLPKADTDQGRRIPVKTA